MRLVPVYCVKEGSHLARTIYDMDGRVLLTKGMKLTSRVLKRIEMNGIMSIYINDGYSDNEIDDVIRPELRQKAVRTMKKSFECLAQDGCLSGSDPIQHSQKNTVKAKYECVENLNEMVNNILDELLSKKDVLINLVDIKSMDNYTYEHCVNVIILSLILGMEIDLSREELFNLAIGAMLHDIGKVFIPREVLQKNSRLTEDEYAIVKEHPMRGYEYLKDNMCITAMSRIVVLQHHERIDGTGYPEGIKGDRIHKFSKIASVVDVYDALTSDRPYRRALPPGEAIEYLMGAAHRQFDLHMVNKFVRRIVPYPVGTLVKLSSGEVGVVEEVSRECTFRPRIRVIDEESRYIDLMKENSIVIEGIQYEAPDTPS